MTFFYATDFILTTLLNNQNFRDFTLNNQSLVSLFQRNDPLLLHSVIFKVVSKNITYEILEKCVEIFVGNSNLDMADLFFGYLIHYYGFYSKITDTIYSKNENFIPDLVILSLQRSITGVKYTFANKLINIILELIEKVHEDQAFQMLDFIIKNVLIQREYEENHFKYLENLFSDPQLDCLFEFIKLADEQNILHFVADKCEITVFSYFLEKHQQKFILLDTLQQSPLDLLIKNTEDESNHKFLGEEIIQPYLKRCATSKLQLRHKSLVHLSGLLINRNHLNLIESLIKNGSFNKMGDQTSENSSLSVFILQRAPDSEMWIYEEEFLKNLNTISSSFTEYKLSHKSFEALCERNNSTLMRSIIHNKNLIFNHDGSTFDTCFEFAIKNDSKDIAYEIFDHFKEVYSSQPRDPNEPSFLSKLIFYIVKYIDKSVDKSNPEFAFFLIQYLNTLNNEADFSDIVKDCLIKTILKVEKFHSLITFLIGHNSRFNLLDFIRLDRGENILHFAAQNCDSEKILHLFNHYIINSDYLNESNAQEKTPLDILIQKKIHKQATKDSTDFLKTLVETLKQAKIKEKDDKLKNKIQSLIDKLSQNKASSGSVVKSKTFLCIYA